MKNHFKFWNPESGAVGGIIFGVVIILIGIIFMPPIMKFIQWWSAFWGGGLFTGSLP